jgi:hypothetical protein
MKVQEVKKTDKTDKELKSHLFQKGEDPRRNLAGRPEGTLNFATKWKKFIEKVAETNEMSPDETEQQLLAVAFKKAKDGDYNFYRDTFDRVYGRAMQPTDITSDGKPLNIQLSEKIKDKYDTNQSTGTDN